VYEVDHHIARNGHERGDPQEGDDYWKYREEPAKGKSARRDVDSINLEIVERRTQYNPNSCRAGLVVVRHVDGGLFIHRAYPPIRRTNEFGEGS
jgi:hypothetical protein